MGVFLVIFVVFIFGMIASAAGVSGGTYAGFVILFSIILSGLSGDITWFFMLVVPALLVAPVFEKK